MFDRAYLGWSLKHVAQNDFFIAISFYRNIFLSQYLFIAKLYAKMSRMNKAIRLPSYLSKLDRYKSNPLVCMKVIAGIHFG